jgi:DNA adenine methylase
VRYLGGKFRIRKQIIAYLESVRKGKDYIEPFCGANWIVSGMTGNRTASDLSEDLILLWQALQQGWIPPTAISEQEYNDLKNAPASALRGFVGYGLSFSGKWFGGYARNSHLRDYCANARGSLLKILDSIKDCSFVHCDYSFYDSTVENCLIYCDPPYAGTTKYRFDFDHSKFWNWVRETSKRNTVVVSEYSAPEDIPLALEISTKTDLRGANQDRIERVYCINA